MAHSRFTSFHRTKPWTSDSGTFHPGVPFSMAIANPTPEKLAAHYDVPEEDVDILEVGEGEVPGYDEGDEVVKVRGEIVGKVERL